MSEWLTTGQMIDELRVGEIADSEFYGLSVTKNSDGRIENVLREDCHLVLSFHTTDEKWKIRPRYVSFEEAMKALKEGKEIFFHTESGGVNRIHLQDSLDWFDTWCWSDVVHGKWTIGK